MIRMLPKKRGKDIWKYPSSADVPEKVGLHTVEHYIGMRRRIIAAFIVNWPIFDLCTEGGRNEEALTGNFGGSKLSIGRKQGLQYLWLK